MYIVHVHIYTCTSSNYTLCTIHATCIGEDIIHVIYFLIQNIGIYATVLNKHSHTQVQKQVAQFTWITSSNRLYTYQAYATINAWRNTCRTLEYESNNWTRAWTMEVTTVCIFPKTTCIHVHHRITPEVKERLGCDTHTCTTQHPVQWLIRVQWCRCWGEIAINYYWPN